ncbi:12937_t:CDS:2 [Funneliformis mosseae]|uniref:12937_t:CDS:1 n=1 Tax=Funneliformis mosseae TaxID=27381 RepID=A0A9N9FVQ1_FUNMO|nr:12937_t:CDS:2 [Funneliformis mosseae]
MIDYNTSDHTDSQVWDFFETEDAKKHRNTGYICKGCEVKDFFIQELRE